MMGFSFLSFPTFHLSHYPPPPISLGIKTISGKIKSWKLDDHNNSSKLWRWWFVLEIVHSSETERFKAFSQIDTMRTYQPSAMLSETMGKTSRLEQRDLVGAREMERLRTSWGLRRWEGEGISEVDSVRAEAHSVEKVLFGIMEKYPESLSGVGVYSWSESCKLVSFPIMDCNCTSLLTLHVKLWDYIQI